MTIEQGAAHLQKIQDKPRSPLFPELTKQETLTSVQGLQAELGRTIIQMSEFQAAYRSPTIKDSLQWEVEYEANDDIYKVGSKLVPAPDKLLERKLEVSMTHNLLPQTWDLQRNTSSKTGPFIKESIVLIMSGDNPLIYYSKEQSDKPEEKVELKNNRETESKIRKFIDVTKILTLEVTNSRRESKKTTQQKTPRAKTQEKQEVAEKELTVELKPHKTSGFLSKIKEVLFPRQLTEFEKQEEWAKKHNKAYKKKIKTRKQTNKDWAKRLEKLKK